MAPKDIALYTSIPGVWKIVGIVAICHFGVTTILWRVGLRHKNHSVLDIYWGFAFVLGGWIAYELGDAGASRAKLALTLVTIWGARLGYHLLGRWARLHPLGGDLRYQDIKDSRIGNEGYWWKSLLFVIWPMAVAIIVAQLNVLWLLVSPNQPPLGVMDFAALIAMMGAILLETVADLQLDAFKANPMNRGKLMTSGVWSWSRHPNYFADFCCYWCLFIISCANPRNCWTIISPLFMSWLLICWTGRRWMDEHMSKRHCDYAEYSRSTSGFVPFPPSVRSRAQRQDNMG